MNIKFSNRVNRIAPSDTIKMTQLARDLRGQGKDIISLSIGEPDFNTPQYIKDAAKKAIDDNFSHYSPVPGFPELKQAIVDKLKKQNGVTYDSNQIVVSTGAKQSLYNACSVLLDQSDEVIIPAPYWVSYYEMVKLCNAKPIVLDTDIKDQFRMSAEKLKAKLNKNTKLIIFSSPSNPTGVCYSYKEIESFVKILADYPDVYILSDEIYEHIYYGETLTSFAHFPEIKHRLLLVNGLSKAYAMTGWRLGYLAGDKDIVKQISKLQGQITSGTCSITQIAAITALNTNLDQVYKMRDIFQSRRDLVYGLLKEIPDIQVSLPQGAFYFFPKISNYYGKKYAQRTIRSCEDLCFYLLDEVGVATVAGKSFGAPGHLRLSFASADKQLIEAIGRIRRALSQLV